MPFVTALIVEDTERPREWKLAGALSYFSPSLQQSIEVPRGFVTDFASVPRILWALIAPTGLHTRAAVIHDWLYERHPVIQREDHVGPMHRLEADEIFLEAMLELGVSRLRARIMYRAVRLFGQRRWHMPRAIDPENILQP